MSKGRAIFVEGRLDFDTWTAQDGSKRSKHRITVESFQFLGDRGSGTQGGAQYDQSASQATPEAEPAPATDDDIPF
jgi:single-strand DNA-binding protein